VFFYIIEKNDKKNKIRTMFCCETHLINNLKTNIFIEINIINFKKIVVDFITCIARIKSCKIIILIEIRISNNIILKLIYFKKSIIISSQSNLLVKIHYFAILKNRNFLFKLNKISYFINYVYLINVITKTIILKNDTNMLIYISRNYRLNKLFKIKYFNAFYLDNIDETRNLVACQLKSHYYVILHNYYEFRFFFIAFCCRF